MTHQEKLMSIFIEERDKFAVAFHEYMKNSAWWEAHKGKLTLEEHLEIFKLTYNKVGRSHGDSSG